MSYAHLFFPENDLALASDLSNYTPPRMARATHAAGETLPMWYGRPGDVFICNGVNNSWFNAMSEAFALRTDVFPHRPEEYTPRPWGWSKATRRRLIAEGFSVDRLPDDAALDAIRSLSHRRSSVIIADALAAFLPDFRFTPPAVEAFPVDEALTVIDAFGGDCVIKSPWSNAGRGIAFTRGFSENALAQRISDIINAYNSVLIERAFDNICDFAMLFESTDSGEVRYVGLSLFETDKRGAYMRNIVANDIILADKIAEFLPENILRPVADSLCAILSDYIGGKYRGPLGIDMLVARTNAGNILNPCVELNLRNTMGHVAHALAENVLAADKTAVFACTVNPDYKSPLITDPLADAIIVGNRLAGGSFCLNPPTSPFLFTLSVS